MLRFVVLALAFVTSSALQIPVTAARPQIARGDVQLALPKLDDARSLSTEEIEKEIAAAKTVCVPH